MPTILNFAFGFEVFQLSLAKEAIDLFEIAADEKLLGIKIFKNFGGFVDLEVGPHGHQIFYICDLCLNFAQIDLRLLFLAFMEGAEIFDEGIKFRTLHECSVLWKT